MPYDSTEIILRLDATSRAIEANSQAIEENSHALEEVRTIAQKGLAQGELTNGRVTVLERDAEIEAALKQQRAEMEATHRRKSDFWRSAAAAAGSGVLLLVGQHFLG